MRQMNERLARVGRLEKLRRARHNQNSAFGRSFGVVAKQAYRLPFFLPPLRFLAI